jgi:hypothetical protein
MTTKGKFRTLRGEMFEGHQIFQVHQIITDGIQVDKHKDYRVGSRIYKDYNDPRCSRGYYKIKVIEY